MVLGFERCLQVANALYRSVTLRCLRALCLGYLIGVGAALARQVRLELPDSRHERTVLGFERCLQAANALYRSVTLRCLRALCLGYLIGVGAAPGLQVRLELPDSRRECVVLRGKRGLQLCDAVARSMPEWLVGRIQAALRFSGARRR